MIRPTFKSDLAVVVLPDLADEALPAALEVLAALVVEVVFEALFVLAESFVCPPQAANESTITADRAIDKSLFFISFLLF